MSAPVASSDSVLPEIHVADSFALWKKVALVVAEVFLLIASATALAFLPFVSLYFYGTLAAGIASFISLNITLAYLYVRSRKAHWADDHFSQTKSHAQYIDFLNTNAGKTYRHEIPSFSKELEGGATVGGTDKDVERGWYRFQGEMISALNASKPDLVREEYGEHYRFANQVGFTKAAELIWKRYTNDALEIRIGQKDLESVVYDFDGISTLKYIYTFRLTMPEGTPVRYGRITTTFNTQTDHATLTWRTPSEQPLN